MITFEQVTQIERCRREIERLQEKLDMQSKVCFHVSSAAATNTVRVDTEFQPFLRETLCKAMVVKILKLLTEAEQLGVDTTYSRKALADFLEQIKPKED